MLIFHYKHTSIPQGNITFPFLQICLVLFVHYKPSTIPQGNITIIWLNMFNVYFSLQTQKDTHGKHYNSLVQHVLSLFFITNTEGYPGKHYNSLVKYVLCFFFITNTKGYPRETLQFFR